MLEKEDSVVIELTDVSDEAGHVFILTDRIVRCLHDVKTSVFTAYAYHICIVALVCIILPEVILVSTRFVYEETSEFRIVVNEDSNDSCFFLGRYGDEMSSHGLTHFLSFIISAV